MIDFRAKLEAIKDFLKTSYLGYLSPFGIEPPEITTEFLDFDKFKASFMLFMEHDRITFDGGRYADDCERTARITCDIFLVFRNAPSADLIQRILDASSALCELFRCEKIDVAHGISIESVEFFNYVEGRNSLVASKISVEFETEC